MVLFSLHCWRSRALPAPSQQWEQRAVNATAGTIELYSDSTKQCLGITRHWLWNGYPVVSLGGCGSGSATFIIEPKSKTLRNAR